MIFALLVCALVLVLVIYFAALMTSEIALWFVNRLAQREEQQIASLSLHR